MFQQFIDQIYLVFFPQPVLKILEYPEKIIRRHLIMINIDPIMMKSILVLPYSSQYFKK